MKVSVIIPVYNAAEFVENAVLSAINQPEVCEVIMVEDGSTDSSFSICQALSKKYHQVKLFYHHKNINKGPSISRNLGIKNASFDYIAFLDSDDWYLPDRFKMDQQIFENYPSVNVVYNKSQIKNGGKYVDFGYFLDVNIEYKTKGYSNVYEFILGYDISLVDMNSFTVRKSLFLSIKLFDERLSIHEDTELLFRIFKNNNIMPGQIKHPVSIARRHINNRITKLKPLASFKFVFVWMDNIGLSNLKDFEKKYIVYRFSRIVSNSIRPHIFRKLVFHGLMQTLNLIRSQFVKVYYYWGLKRFQFQK